LQVLATLALALVLFSDAVTIDTGELGRERALVLRLLGPGTLLPAAITAAAAWLLLDVSPAAAAILGAALASTDPVVLRGVLRSGAVGPRVRLALRLETGMNDVVLLPILALAILLSHATAASGGATTQDVGRALLGLFVLGPLLGAFVGWVGITALVQVRGRLGVRRDYESLYALGLAFTGYAMAEAVGGSGFLAAFAAGLVIAAQDVELCDCFMEYGEATAEMLLLFTFVAFGTSSIWSGLDVVDPRTLAFVAVAILVRPVVLFPVLRGAGLASGDCRLISLLGPRGLSSLLLALLAVYAGVPGAARLFAVTSLVVLVSLVLHGTAIAVFLRRHRPTVSRPPATPAAAESTEAARETEEERLTFDELDGMLGRGERMVIVDARSAKSYDADQLTAKDAVRLHPDDPVSEAERLRLPRDATLVVFCA
jgi:NhaP-type Na+/H+ or K+/H+ antiporter